MNNRLKSYALWISIFAFIPLFLESIGYNILPANYNEVVKAFLGILVLAGVINSPTTENKGYFDDKKE